MALPRTECSSSSPLFKSVPIQRCTGRASNPGGYTRLWSFLNHGPFFFPHACVELRAYFDPTLKTEAMDEGPDGADRDGPPTDPPGSEAHAAPGGARPTSAPAQEAQQQELEQDLDLQLDRLRKETGRSVRAGQ